MVAKRWRFERVLPSLTVAFGLITLGGGFIHTYGALVALRLILGLFEGCLFPCLALFLANWYKREEMAVRMAFLFGKDQASPYLPLSVLLIRPPASSALAGAFGGLFAYAIFHMNGAAGIPGWRWYVLVVEELLYGLWPV